MMINIVQPLRVHPERESKKLWPHIGESMAHDHPKGNQKARKKGCCQKGRGKEPRGLLWVSGVRLCTSKQGMGLRKYDHLQILCAYLSESLQVASHKQNAKR